LACIADGHISQEEWNYLVSATHKLGIRLDELLKAIQPQAQCFVEHVLADAKADGLLSAHEEAILGWLTNNLGLPEHYREYVRQEVWLLRLLTEIDAGRLPTIPCPPGMEVRAREIIHLHIQATWRDVRVRKTGPHTEDHVGTLALTDNRLLFSSPTKPQLGIFRARFVSGCGSATAGGVLSAGRRTTSNSITSFPSPKAEATPTPTSNCCVVAAIRKSRTTSNLWRLWWRALAAFAPERRDRWSKGMSSSQELL
jgi:hypothetical protein